MVKNLPANARVEKTLVQFLGQEDPLDEGIPRVEGTHSSILAWEIP